ncbi:MAG: GAF domain-containing protein [Symploca sp. SIO2E6]|nr:GAF domain-containing protein [Symploca sp. SIO2E6]
MNAVKTKYSLSKLQLDSLPYDMISKGLFSSQEASSVQENSQLLTASFLYAGKQYILASIPQTDWVAVASMDSGEIANAGSDLVWVFALIFLALGGITIPLVLRLAQQLSAPITNLSETAEAVTTGNLDLAAEPVGTAEIQTLAHTFNKLVARVKTLLREQATETEQAQLFADIASAPTRSATDLEYVFSQATQGAQQILQADRVVIYRFNPDGHGYISAESVTSDWPQALGDKIDDSCIGNSLIEAYRKGRVVPTNNILEAGFHPEHLQLMERLKIKANLVTPILKDGELFGLLIAHHCSAPHVWQDSEIEFLKQLAMQVGFSLDRVKFVDQQQAETERFQQLNTMISLLRESLEVEQIYNTALTGIRSTLKTDRVLVYLFDENWQGTIVAESVGEGWPKALGEKIADPCFAKQYVEKYQQGRVKATDNIEQAGLTPCHLDQLEPYQVKANLVAPILAYGKLHGLLVTHQCSSPRHWQSPEINFFKQVAIQVGSALDQIALLEQQKEARQKAEAISVEQRQQKEALQQQLLELLEEVEGAACGDLTVRAEVGTGEIGTVADFFNAVIESLRAIVTQVKTSTFEVNTSLGQNEGALRQLSEETFKQAEETTRTLESVEQMTYSIQQVAQNAQKAAEVSRASSNTALEGGKVMDRTLENILVLRETISETAKKVKRLGESSQQISKAISLIEKIALQTNLLAINAGIEAARAGEQGQGFAVVAEEVGQLAAQSTAATKEIEEIVDSIQQETNQVVEAMEQSTTQVVEGTTLAIDAKESLEEIVQVSHQIDQLVQSISDATVSQTQTSQAITNVMSEMAFVSARNSDASNQVSLSLQQTVEIAQKLQESVGQFKIGAQA